MELAELANIGEFVGGVAVLVTLIYLVIQVRQGNSNSRASARQSLIDTWSKTMFDLGHDRELLRIGGAGFRDFESLSDPDKTQFVFLMSQYVGNVYNGILLYREGLLDLETLDQIGGLIAWAVVMKGGSAWWELTIHPQEVKDYIRDYLDRKGDEMVSMEEGIPFWTRPWPEPAPSY